MVVLNRLFSDGPWRLIDVARSYNSSPAFINKSTHPGAAIGGWGGGLCWRGGTLDGSPRGLPARSRGLVCTTAFFAGDTRCQRRRVAQSTSSFCFAFAAVGYSSRSASTGATLDARSAGSSDAASTVARKMAAPTAGLRITRGDAVGLRPDEPRGSPCARSPSEHARHGNRQAVPQDHPDDVPALAPSATRTPISRTRAVTENAISPYTPMQARRTVSAAANVANPAVNVPAAAHR